MHPSKNVNHQNANADNSVHFQVFIIGQSTRFWYFNTSYRLCVAVLFIAMMLYYVPVDNFQKFWGEFLTSTKQWARAQYSVSGDSGMGLYMFLCINAWASQKKIYKKKKEKKKKTHQ